MNRHSRPLPAFGRMPLDRIGPEDVAAWFDAASKDKPGAANRAFEILRATMFRAEERGLRERGSNPCLGIAKNPRNHFARFLDADELARLGRALDTGKAEWPEAVAAIRLLALTGCRRSEVLNLRWRDIGEGYREMLERLARESGVETPTAENLARLDRKRKGTKLSNTDWVSKSDPEAKIAEAEFLTYPDGERKYAGRDDVDCTECGGYSITDEQPLERLRRRW